MVKRYIKNYCGNDFDEFVNEICQYRLDSCDESGIYSWNYIMRIIEKVNYNWFYYNGGSNIRVVVYIALYLSGKINKLSFDHYLLNMVNVGDFI